MDSMQNNQYHPHRIGKLSVSRVIIVVVSSNARKNSMSLSVFLTVSASTLINGPCNEWHLQNLSAKPVNQSSLTIELWSNKVRNLVHQLPSMLQKYAYTPSGFWSNTESTIVLIKITKTLTIIFNISSKWIC